MASFSAMESIPPYNLYSSIRQELMSVPFQTVLGYTANPPIPRGQKEEKPGRFHLRQVGEIGSVEQMVAGLGQLHCRLPD